MPKPKIPVIGQDVLEGLYEMAAKFRKLRPWMFMEDDQLFGVQNPDTGEIAYCCVMGAMGQVLGLAAYRGTEGLEFWRRMQRGEITPEHAPDIMFMQDCLLVTFENKKDLEAEDKMAIARCGLKFSGSRPYPQFRSHRPGFMAWYLNEADAKFMAFILGIAAMDFVPCLIGASGIPLPENEDGDEDQVLVYLAKRASKEQIEVEPQWVTPEPIKEKPAAMLRLDEIRIHRLKQLKLGQGGTWEADWFYLPSTIHDRDVPYFARIALIADKKSGYIYNVEPMPLEQATEAGVLAALLGAIEKTNTLPVELRVSRLEIERALKLIATELDFAVVHKDSLAAIEEAKEALFESELSGGSSDEIGLF